MNFRCIIAEKSNQRWYSSQLSSLGLNGVVHIAEMLQIGRCIGFDNRVGILQELDDLVQVWISPLNPGHCICT